MGRDPEDGFLLIQSHVRSRWKGKEGLLKGFITEKRKGLVSWIHFGEEDLRSVLKGLRSPVMKEARPKGSLIGRRATDITSLKVEK